MRTGAGREETENAEPVRVDLPDSVRVHVGDVEDPAVGGELHVLRHVAAAAGKVDGPYDALVLDVHHDHLARELTAREQEAAVGGEVHVVDALARHRYRAV